MDPFVTFQAMFAFSIFIIKTFFEILAFIAKALIGLTKVVLRISRATLETIAKLLSALARLSVALIKFPLQKLRKKNLSGTQRPS